MNESGKSILETPLSANRLVELIKVIESGKISNTAGKVVFEAIINEDKEVEDIIQDVITSYSIHYTKLYDL